MTLLINEIFYSIQGESTSTGFPSLFIRLTGCNLRCRYCDTEYAYSEGREVAVESLVKTAAEYPFAQHITITGGEPMAQDGVRTLINRLIEEGHSVQIETNGSLSLAGINDLARKIIDIKSPSSGEGDSFLMENLEHINGHDEIKFVLATDEDYAHAKSFFLKHLRSCKGTVNFSPIYGALSYANLADRILNDRLPVRLNVQLHKMIGLESELEKRIKIIS